MAGYPVETCRGCRSTERASMMYSLSVEDTRKLFSECTRLQLPNAEETESQGQLCAPCYEYCEGWFEYKTMCWKNNEELRRGPDLEEVDELSDQDSVIMNGVHDEITIESEDYDCHGYDEERSISSSPMLPDKTNGELEDSATVEEEDTSKEEEGERLDNMDSEWQCPSCEVAGKTYDAFRNHFRDMHLNGNSCRCPICGVTLSRNQTLYFHVFGVHMGKLDCPHCQKVMPTFRGLQDHIGFNHASDNFKEPVDWTCLICSHGSGDYYEFRAHLTTTHLEGRVSICPLCHFSFNPKEALINHIMSIHMNARDCRLCGKRCGKYSDLRAHFKACPKRLSEPLPLPPRPINPYQSASQKRTIAIQSARLLAYDSTAQRPPRRSTSQSSSPPSTSKLPSAAICEPRPSISEPRGQDHDEIESNWDCPICMEKLTDYNAFRGHLKKIHASKEDLIHKCPLCSCSYLSMGKFYRHIVEKHMLDTKDPRRGKKKYELYEKDDNWDCPACGEKFTEYTALRLHLRELHMSMQKDGYLKCPMCESAYSTTGIFYAHILKRHMKKWDCVHCGRTCDSTAAYQEHMYKCNKLHRSGDDDEEEEDMSESEGAIEDDDSSSDLSDSSDSDNSKEASSQPEVKKFKTEPLPMETAHAVNWDCMVCDMKFDDYSEFRIHTRRYHINKNEGCPVCAKPFALDDSCFFHIIRVHMLKFECPVCHSQLSSFKSINKHMKEEHNGGGFDRTLNLFFASTPIDFAKPVAGVPYTMYTPLLHERAYSKEEILAKWDDWNCVVCSMEFNRSRDLRAHVLYTHVKKEDPACPLCDSTFSTLQHIFRHVVSVHMRKFSCLMCYHTSPTFTRFVYHMSKEHKIDLENDSNWDDN